MAAIWYELHKLNALNTGLQLALSEVAAKGGISEEKVTGIVTEAAMAGLEHRLHQIEEQVGGMHAALLWEIAEAEEW